MEPTATDKELLQVVTTTSDVELVVVKLTEAGSQKVEQGLPISISDVITPVGNYTRVRTKVNKYLGNTYDAVYDDTEGRGTATNCYLSTYEMDVDTGGKQAVDCIIVTIPSGTFCDEGRLYAAITTQNKNTHFEDQTQDTETAFAETEVHYVLQ